MNEAQHLTEIDFETLTEEESRELLNMLRSEVDNIEIGRASCRERV